MPFLAHPLLLVLLAGCPSKTPETGAPTDTAACIATTEVCDGLDNDCDGRVDEDLVQDEVCDGLDNDCDNQVDEGVTTPFFADADRDGFGDPLTTKGFCEAPEGWSTDATDCDDARSDVHPGATETCNGLDDNCDGDVDEGLLFTWYTDADGDGYGDPTAFVEACEEPLGMIADDTDCNDADAGIHPDAAEDCDGIDNDCDALVDEDLASPWYADLDADGYGDPTTRVMACAAPVGFIADGTDCDDADAAIHPGAAEDCDGIDNDCDGVTDEDLLTAWHPDVDGDGWGDPWTETMACSPGIGWTTDATDCNDTDATVHPTAPEACNGVDDDCDVDVDEDVLSTFFVDADGDGWGSSAVTACDPPSGTVPSSGDCDDANAAVHPGATETANGIDDDCDGAVDEALDTGPTPSCPDEMVLVDEIVCVDRYEASRPDATATSGGSDSSKAVSAAGVIPWYPVDNATADAACAAAGKRLCTADEWYKSCAGPDETTYAYGDTYVPETCNGIDSTCLCDPRYAGCYYDCGGTYGIQPTGAFSDCVGTWGVHDMNGNVWEHVAGGDDTTIRGGAYNCGDSETYHRCDYVPGTWTPSARGFRCCMDP